MKVICNAVRRKISLPFYYPRSRFSRGLDGRKGDSEITYEVVGVRAKRARASSFKVRSLGTILGSSAKEAYVSSIYILAEYL